MTDQSPKTIAGHPLSGAHGYAHPTTLQEFESVYRREYERELESCDSWIKWCDRQADYYGVNFHQGMRAAHVFNNIKMEQLLRVLKQEAPNVGQNAAGERQPAENQERMNMKRDQSKTETSAAVGSSDIVSRELEIKQVELAISKTEAAQVRAMETLDKLYDKKSRQTAELRFQKMLLSMDKQRAAQSANK